MAELTDQFPRDVVTCRCSQTWDRNVYSQCSHCSANLWDPAQLAQAPPAPEPETDPAPRGATTVFEPDPARGIDVLVCGRRLTLPAGRPVALGRDDDCETVDVFRDCMNVSRAHAVLRFDGSALIVTDVGSTNGTYVDGDRLPTNHPYEVRPGQTLRLASNVPVEIQWES